MKDWIHGHPVLMIAVTLACVLLAFRSVFITPTHPDLRGPPLYERAVGYALGQEAARILGGEGKVLIIRMPLEGKRARKDAKGYVEGVEAALKGSGVSIAGVVPDSPLPGAYLGMDEPSIPLEVFRSYLDAHPEAGAVISFFGFPACAPEELPATVPPLLVANSFNPARYNWIRSGRAAAMVMGRKDAPYQMHHSPSVPPLDLFNRLHLLITPENVESALTGSGMADPVH